MKTRGLHRRLAEGAHAHFVPSHRNDHVPHVLKHHVLLGYSLIFILVKALFISAHILLPASSVYSGAVTAENIIRLTNVARAAAGLPELKANGRLASAAFEKAEDMVLNGYFAHTSPAGLAPWHWIRKNGYDYRYAGENLAIHFFTAEGAHEGWMASPTHRSNILDERYSEIGVGVARGRYDDYDTIFVVQMFGRPKAEEAPAPAAPAAVEPAPPAAPEPEPEPPPPSAAVKVLPVEEGYKVTLAAAENVASATVLVGGSAAEFAPDGEGGLEAVVSVDKKSLPQEGERVYLTTVADDGRRETESVAVVAPNAAAQELFIAADARPPFKLFGRFEIRGLEDAVRRFYLAMSVLLSAALAAAVLIRFEVQRHSVTFHAIFVIGLALALAFI